MKSEEGIAYLNVVGLLAGRRATLHSRSNQPSKGRETLEQICCRRQAYNISQFASYQTPAVEQEVSHRKHNVDIDECAGTLEDTRNVAGGTRAQVELLLMEEPVPCA